MPSRSSPPRRAGPSDKPVSIVDVARRAGVSVGTVSNVLNHPERVRPKTAKHVQAVIETLGFRPNVIAKSLRERRTMTIGLVLSDITTPFASELARAAEGEASAGQWSVVFVDTREDIVKERQAIRNLHQNSVEGVMLAPAPGDHTYLKPYLDLGWPIVAVNRRVEGVEAASVLTDHRGAATQATNHLLGHGHRHLGVVTRSPEISSVADRIAGYRDALTAAGISPSDDLIEYGGATVDGGRLACERLLALDPRPTAIMSFTSVMTLGCVSAFREHGVRVPQDVAFMGFDDAVWSPVMSPPISSVALRAEQVGSQAARLLLDWLATGEPPATPTRRIDVDLVLRASCGCNDTQPPPQSRPPCEHERSVISSAVCHR